MYSSRMPRCKRVGFGELIQIPIHFVPLFTHTRKKIPSNEAVLAPGAGKFVKKGSSDFDARGC